MRILPPPPHKSTAPKAMVLLLTCHLMMGKPKHIIAKLYSRPFKGNLLEVPESQGKN